MNYLQYSPNLINQSMFTVLRESGPTNEIEMIQLSTWEWFLLLVFTMLLIWLLVLFQVKSTNELEPIEKSHVNHEEFINNHS